MSRKARAWLIIAGIVIVAGVFFWLAYLRGGILLALLAMGVLGGFFAFHIVKETRKARDRRNDS